MKIKKLYLRSSTHAFRFLVPLVLWAGSQVSGFSYSALVAFGDSYTDTGNVPASPPNYYNGRYSNGQLWVEYLSQELGFAYEPTNNYALSGSESDELEVEIGRFGGGLDPNETLFAIWAGNNDIINHLTLGTNDAAWTDQINHTVASVSGAADLLYQKGALNVIVFNVFDLTRLPALRNSYSGAFLDYVQSKILQLNSQLADALTAVAAADSGLQIYQLDAFTDMNSLLDNYQAQGFTQASVSALSDAGLTDKSFTGPGASYVFWDDTHPTTKAHSIISTWALDLVPAEGVPPVPVLISPSDEVTPADTVRYTWQPDATATWYELYISHGSAVLLDKWYKASDLIVDDSGNLAVDVPGHTSGSYVWWVRAWNSAGYSDWSDSLAFDFPLPGSVVLVSPSDVIDPSPTVTYTWQPDATATWYQLYISRNGKPFLDKWYLASDLTVDDSGNLNVDVPGHSDGTYTWWVQGWSSAGYGPWSDSLSFSFVTPGAVTLLYPSDVLDPASTVTYTWQPDATATWYELFISKNGKVFLDQWYASSNLVTDDSGDFMIDVSNHTGGTYTWWVRDWSSAGYGPWSDSLTFSFQAPGAVALVSPVDDMAPSTNVTYTWQPDATATWYELYIEKNGQLVLDQWYSVTNLATDDSGNLSVDVPDSASGTNTWWVRDWSSAGYGPWSDSLTFSFDAPAAVNLVSPSDVIDPASTVTYTWQPDATATWYELYINKDGQTFLDHWYAASDLTVDASGNLTVDVPGHTSGSYEWWVRDWSSAGYGDWSESQTFSF